MPWPVICDGYVTPRRHTPASPDGFGVPDTFCGHDTLTQGLHPVLYYVTPSGFAGDRQRHCKHTGNTLRSGCTDKWNSDAPRCVPTRYCRPTCYKDLRKRVLIALQTGADYRVIRPLLRCNRHPFITAVHDYRTVKRAVPVMRSRL